MGSPQKCYKRILMEYIRLNVSENPKLKKQYNENYLYNLEEKELEEIAKSFSTENPMNSAFLGGVAVGNCINNCSNDELNTFGAILEDFQKLIGIKIEE